MRTLFARAVVTAPLWVPDVALAQTPLGGMLDDYGSMLGGWMGGYGGFLGPVLLVLTVLVGVAVWAVKQKSR